MADAEPVAIPRRRWRIPGGFPVALLLVWLACAAVLCLAKSSLIAQFGLLDPDDAMRLLEVRDWIGGQSWFDVTQYRLDPPHGFAMHWSRLVDVPIGLTILAVRPVFGEHVAEITACVVTPMVTLGAAMAFVALITRRLAGEGAALLAAAFCTLSFGTFYAMRPMRIDHHGWQIVAGLGIVHALIGPRTIRRTAIAGLWAALWMHISLEGIVFSAVAAAWLGLRWIARPDEESYRLPAFLGAMVTGSLGLFLVAHGGALFDRTFCDAVSPVHMAVFAIAAIGTGIACRARPSSAVARIACLGAAAIASAAVYKLSAPQCLVGPFNTLDPLTYNLWYRNIGEGMPLWKKPTDEFVMWLLYPLAGLIGGVLVLRRAPEGEARADALDAVALLAGATLIGVTVMRASAFANTLAIPSGVCLLIAAMRRIAAMRFMAARVIGLALVPLLLNPVSPGLALASGGEEPARPGAATQADEASVCRSIDNLTALDALPSATIMTPIDLAPSMLVASHHKAVGAGYHRNPAAIHDTLAFFTGDDATARGIARAHGVSWVVVCQATGEFDILGRYAKGGLAARIARGQTPAWLRPTTVPGLRYAQVYAVIG